MTTTANVAFATTLTTPEHHPLTVPVLAGCRIGKTHQFDLSLERLRPIVNRDDDTVLDYRDAVTDQKLLVRVSGDVWELTDAARAVYERACAALDADVERDFPDLEDWGVLGLPELPVGPALLSEGDVYTGADHFGADSREAERFEDLSPQEVIHQTGLLTRWHLEVFVESLPAATVAHRALRRVVAWRFDFSTCTTVLTVAEVREALRCPSGVLWLQLADMQDLGDMDIDVDGDRVTFTLSPRGAVFLEAFLDNTVTV